jgi:hypothetical protein
VLLSGCVDGANLREAVEPASLGTVEFLAGPDSNFITGQIFSVNGGQYI